MFRQILKSILNILALNLTQIRAFYILRSASALKHKLENNFLICYQLCAQALKYFFIFYRTLIVNVNSPSQFYGSRKCPRLLYSSDCCTLSSVCIDIPYGSRRNDPHRDCCYLELLVGLQALCNSIRNGTSTALDRVPLFYAICRFCTNHYVLIRPEKK